MSNFQIPYFFLTKNQKNFHKKNQKEKDLININNNNLNKKEDFFNKIYKKIK